MRHGLRSLLTAAAGAAITALISFSVAAALGSAGARLSCAARCRRPSGLERHLAGAEQSELRHRDAHGAAGAGSPGPDRTVRCRPPPVLALGAVGSVPPGMGVVEGESCPTSPKRLRRGRRTTRTGSPPIRRSSATCRACRGRTTCRIRSRFFQSSKAIFFAYEYAGAIAQYLPEGSRAGTGRLVDGAVGRQVGRRHAGRRRHRLQRSDAGSIAPATSTATKLHVVERYTRTGPDRHQLRSHDRGSERVHAAVENEHAALSTPRQERAADGLQVRRVRRGTDVRAVAQEPVAARDRQALTCADFGTTAIAVLAWRSRCGSPRAVRQAPARPARRSGSRSAHGRWAPRSSGHVRRGDHDAARNGRRRSTTAVDRSRKRAQLEAAAAARTARANGQNSGNRSAPPIGGDGSTGAAGGVGGYNNFWIDSGDPFTSSTDRRGRRSSSIRPNGRIPPLTAAARQRQAAARCAADVGCSRRARDAGLEQRRRLRRSRAASARRTVPARIRLDVRTTGAARALQQPPSDRADARTPS